MKTLTATALARNLSQVLDALARGGEEIVIERNQRPIARLVPGPARVSALEALGGLYRTLPEAAAEGWIESGRKLPLRQGLGALRDPWCSS
jgi:antitoxin (DNA-binding transcriptional repressor) of toxin-antitoxin stability system